MEREGAEEVGRSTFTRRQILGTGAKLALLWTFPIIRSGTALANGSQTVCDGQHAAHKQVNGQACNQAAAMRKLEKAGDRAASKFCGRLDSCPSANCASLSRGPLSNVTCTQVPDPNCKKGLIWTCTGTLTSVTCQCQACGCDPTMPCNVAIDCHNSGGACNCWATSPDHPGGSACFCGEFVQFCGATPLCPNGQPDCDSQLPGSTCVGTCCGQVCAPPCGARVVRSGSGNGRRRTTRTS